jgi:hypothetical protein
MVRTAPAATQEDGGTAKDRALKQIDEAIERLARLTDAALFSEEVTRLLELRGRFYRYSLGNVLLIQAQRPGATHVAGFSAWLRLGRCVRKGEKGITILVPHPYRKTKPPPKAKAGARATAPPAAAVTVTAVAAGGAVLEDEDADRGVSFGVGFVFDVSQTDPLPGKPDTFVVPDWGIGGDHEPAYRRLLRVAFDAGIVVDWETLDPGHYGTSFGGRIVLAEALRADSGQRTLVLAHELGHERLHKTAEVRRVTPRHLREQQAEGVAYVVGAHLGIDARHAPAYAALYGGTAESIRASLDAIAKGSRWVIEWLDADGARPGPGAAEADPDITF